MTTYQFIKKLGSGGMADVWLAVAENESGLKRVCAIKKAHIDADSGSEMATMFEDEMRLAQTLNHANIVKALDLIHADGEPALVMEFVAGIDVYRLAARFAEIGSSVPLDLILYIGSEAAKGLQYLHTARDVMTGKPLSIIHRDISPANILVSIDGEVKISDFGVAKNELNRNQTSAGIVKGKYAYMSPEQITGEVLDHRSDIYSLGIVLWELIAQRRMFEANSDAELMLMVSRGNPHASIRAVSPMIDVDLAAIIDAATAPQKSARFASAGDLSDKLLRYLLTKSQTFSPAKVATIIRNLCQTEVAQITALLDGSAAKGTERGPPPRKPVVSRPAEARPPAVSAVPSRPVVTMDREEGQERTMAPFPPYTSGARILEASTPEPRTPEPRTPAPRNVPRSNDEQVAAPVGAKKAPVQRVHSEPSGDQFTERGVDLTYAGGGTAFNEVVSRNLPKSDHRPIATGSNPRAQKFSRAQVMIAPQRQTSSLGLWMFLLVGIAAIVAFLVVRRGF